MIHGATPEAVDHVERALVLGRSASVRSFCVAAVYASILRAFRGLATEAVSVVDEADARLDVEPDRWAQAWIDWVRSGLVNKAGDPAAAAELLRSSVAASTAEGDQCAAAIAAIRLGELAELRGDYDEANDGNADGVQHVDGRPGRTRSTRQCWRRDSEISPPCRAGSRKRRRGTNEV